MTIAKKLGPYAGAPPAVARRLARDVIDVADPILRHTQVLTIAELDAVARDFGINHAVVIAARREPDKARQTADRQAPAKSAAQIVREAQATSGLPNCSSRRNRPSAACC